MVEIKDRNHKGKQGAYAADDHARHSFLKRTALPGLRWGKVPVPGEHDQRTLPDARRRVRSLSLLSLPRALCARSDQTVETVDQLALRASNLAVRMPAPQTLLALGEMPCGADVEMHSLVRSPELIGVRRQVVEPQDPGPGRCGVKIDSDGGRVLALKPANLVRLCGNAACRQALAPPLLQ
jgi:hypothetical protein